MGVEIILGTADGVHAPTEGRVWLPGESVTSLVAGETGELWAVVDGHRLVRIGGDDPVTVAETDAAIACIEAFGGSVWCGTDGAHLLRLDGGRLVAVPGFDEAPTHDGWHTPWGGPPTVWTMASAGPALYVNVHVGGILTSADGGRTWSPTIDLHDDVHQVAVGDDGTLWSASGAGGLARSDDGGATWSSVGEAPAESYLRSLALVDGGVVVGGSVGPHASSAHLYRFDRHGAVHRLGGGLPEPLGGNVDAYRLAGRGRVVVVADPGGSVYQSDDGGDTWVTVVADPPVVTAVVLR